ncbi:MAG: hypothetical protein WCE21_04615 [Candidatus Babeliales bacterium]
MQQTIFGTDGIRASFGTHLLTIENSIALGFALGAWLRIRANNQAVTLYIARDSRISGDIIQSSIQIGLLANGITIHDTGIMPISALFYGVTHTHDAYGIMISASHNLYTDNGIKIIGPNGKLTALDEQRITAFFNYYRTSPYDYSVLTPEKLGTVHYASCIEQYRSYVCSRWPAHFLQGKKIVLDCANGAASIIAPDIFKAYGADVISLHNTPNGTNINAACGSTDPRMAQQAVIQHGAYAGFAFDGDGDRVVAIDAHGALKDGDHILALLAGTPDTQTASVVGTVMSNSGLELFLKQRNKRLVRANVGEKAVLQMMQRESASLGGEPSGHILLHEYMPSSDGIIAALATLHAMEQINNHTMETFVPFAQFNAAVTITHKKPLANSELQEIITRYEQQLQHGRLVVRYSGTEPLLRIMVEEADDTLTQLIGTRLTEALKGALQK